MKYKAKLISKTTLITRIFLLILFFCFIVLPTYFVTSSSLVRCKSYTLDNNWDIRVNQTLYENKTLSTFRFDMCNRGDYVIYETKLPLEAGGIIEPILGFYSMHSVIHIYLDHELIYSYGVDDYKAGNFVGYGSHNIPLPKSYVGKTLRIELLITENRAFNGQDPLTIKDGRYFILEKISANRLQFAVSFFLVICGVLFMIFSIIHIREANNFVERFCISTFSFLIGIWSLCNSDLISLIIPDLTKTVQIQYMCFYTFTIPFTYYFKPRIMQENRPHYQKVIFITLLVIEVFVAAVSITCNTLNVFHFPSFTMISHVLLLLVVAFVILLFITDVQEETYSRNVLLSFLLATIGISLELFRFNIAKYLSGVTNHTYGSLICYSSLLVACSLLYDYERSVSKHVEEDVQQELLLEFAYSDSLSGLSNRRKCEETLKLFTDLSTPYLVISLDMNFLKKINDTYGHHVGDAMIKDFSQILQETFGTFGTVGRMGGDEFIVILPNMNAEQVREKLKQMEEQIEQHNCSSKEYPLSCAYGFALSEEGNDSDFFAAYKLADERMYENKRKSRLGRT